MRKIMLPLVIAIITSLSACQKEAKKRENTLTTNEEIELTLLWDEVNGSIMRLDLETIMYATSRQRSKKDLQNVRKKIKKAIKAINQLELFCSKHNELSSLLCKKKRIRKLKIHVLTEKKRYEKINGDKQTIFKNS